MIGMCPNRGPLRIRWPFMAFQSKHGGGGGFLETTLYGTYLRCRMIILANWHVSSDDSDQLGHPSSLIIVSSVDGCYPKYLFLFSCEQWLLTIWNRWLGWSEPLLSGHDWNNCMKKTIIYDNTWNKVKAVKKTEWNGTLKCDTNFWYRQKLFHDDYKNNSEKLWLIDDHIHSS